MRNAPEADTQPEPVAPTPVRPAAAKPAVQPPKRRFRWDRVRVVCAWCDQTIARTERSQRRAVSHGLCAPCAKRLSVRTSVRS